MILFAIALAVVTLGIAAVGSQEPGGGARRIARMLGVCPLWGIGVLAALVSEHFLSVLAAVAGSLGLIALSTVVLLFGWWPSIRAAREGVWILRGEFPATFRTGTAEGGPLIRFLEFSCSVPDTPWKIRVAGPEWRLHAPPWAASPSPLDGWERYAVFTTDPRAAAVISPDLLTDLDQLHSGGILVDFVLGQLRVRDTAHRIEPDNEERFIARAYRLASEIRRRIAAPPPAVVEITDRAAGTTAPGICQVCGTAMTERRVECAACRTPHHRECFDYNGECATYGCGGTATSSDGQPATPAPPEPIRSRLIDGLPFPATLRTGSTLDEPSIRFVEFSCGVPGPGASVRILGGDWRAHPPTWASAPVALPDWPGYGVFATDRARVERMLREPVPQLVRELDRQHEGRVLIDLHDGRLTIRDTTRRGEPDATEPFVQYATLLAAHLRDRLAQAPSQTPDVHIISESTGGAATCHVCRTAIQAARVECRRCATPHHRECWEFNGRCGTYGCRSARFRAAHDAAVRDRRHSHGTCPACDTIVRIDPRSCPRCGAAHHAACWEHRRGCSACAIARR